MGKRYYCEYCNKGMVDTPSIVRTHNNGLVHQRFVQDHYQQFKDPETILAEESKKMPCRRFAGGHCQFGSICRFSHYTREQIDSLKELVASKNVSESEAVYPSLLDMVRKLLSEKSNKSEELQDGNTMLYDNNGITHVFPWTYNPMFDSYEENLPPSIKRLKLEDFSDAKFSTWG